MQIISFSGLAECGKTTALNAAAAWSVDNGFTPRLESFAGPLKRAATAIGAEKGGKRDALYRKFCQYVGTELVRNPDTAPGITGCDYWVDLMKINFDVLAHEEQSRLHEGTSFHETLILIDDARFLNELEAITKYSGTNIFLDANRRLKNLDAEWRKHPSEDLARDYAAGKLSDTTFDFTISSNGELESFKRLIRSMMPVWSGQIAEERIVD